MPRSDSLLHPLEIARQTEKEMPPLQHIYRVPAGSVIRDGDVAYCGYVRDRGEAGWTLPREAPGEVCVVCEHLAGWR